MTKGGNNQGRVRLLFHRFPRFALLTEQSAAKQPCSFVPGALSLLFQMTVFWWFSMPGEQLGGRRMPCQ